MTSEYNQIYERYEAGVRHRLYGLSENLAFTYPYVLAVIGFYSLVEKKNLVSVLLLVLVVITILFNARIAFVPIILIIPFVLFFKKNDVKTITKFILITFCFFLLFNALLTSHSEFDNSWGGAFFDEMYDLLTTGKSETTSTLTGKMLFLPDNSLFTFLFGTGESVFLSKKHNSDVGYVIQLYYGGMFIFILVLSIMFYMAHRVLKVLGKNKAYRSFCRLNHPLLSTLFYNNIINMLITFDAKENPM